MAALPQSLQDLIEQLKKLPGVGGKTREIRHHLQTLVAALVEVVLPGEVRVPSAVPRQSHHHDLFLQGTHHIHPFELLIADQDSRFHPTHMRPP